MLHEMRTTSESPDHWTIECAACGAVRLVFKDGRPFQTLSQGHPAALHSWSSTDGVSLTAAIAPQARDETPGNLFARSLVLDRADWRHSWRPARCTANTPDGIRCEMDDGHVGSVTIHGSSLDDHNARTPNGKWRSWASSRGDGALAR